MKLNTKANFRFSDTLSSMLLLVKKKGVNISFFVREAINEKIKREYPKIYKEK